MNFAALALYGNSLPDFAFFAFYKTVRAIPKKTGEHFCSPATGLPFS
jgi:hypothetical protein